MSNYNLVVGLARVKKSLLTLLSVCMYRDVIVNNNLGKDSWKNSTLLTQNFTGILSVSYVASVPFTLN